MNPRAVDLQQRQLDFAVSGYADQTAVQFVHQGAGLGRLFEGDGRGRALGTLIRTTNQNQQQRR